MKTVGIICEYNPLHRGHQKQIGLIREQFGPDTAVCCLMSGNYVQRGAPAVVDKSLRARAAILAGADLVLELPVTYALSSAEGFAAGGVRILSSFCDVLCFGSETGDKKTLLTTARFLLSEEFPPLLRQELQKGLSFPAARQAALENMGLDGSLLRRPNDILAVEYCKAILAGNRAITPMPIPRRGSYHETLPDPENPSATALRTLMESGAPWLPYVPEDAAPVLSQGKLHTLRAGEPAILARLRAMEERDFAALPYGSEGLWRKLMRAVRQEASLEEILTAVKSKRYTRSRLDRMVLCAFLGLTEADLLSPAPYVRVLAFNGRGRAILKEARKTGAFLNAGEIPDSPYWERERRIGDLYGLFAVDGPEPPGGEARRRVYCAE